MAEGRGERAEQRKGMQGNLGTKWTDGGGAKGSLQVFFQCLNISADWLMQKENSGGN